MSAKDVSRDLSVTQLIANSARTSKRRLFPLENDHTLRRRKVLLPSDRGGSVTDRIYRDSSGSDSYSDDSRTTLGDTHASDTNRTSAEVKSSCYYKAQSILGSSSSQPLRLRSQNIVDRKKNRIFRFVGDQQPSTDMGMANLFGAHPARKISLVQGGPTSTSSLHVPTNENSVGLNSFYEQTDESIHLAGIDVEPPPAELLQHIKSLAADKIATQIAAMKGLHGSSDDYSHLENSFDDSALVAIGIFVEELVRDMIVSWYKSGSPLTFDPRALRTEALAQINGSTANDVPIPLLTNRLEVLFNRSFGDRQQRDISVYHEVATMKSKKKRNAKEVTGASAAGTCDL